MVLLKDCGGGGVVASHLVSLPTLRPESRKVVNLPPDKNIQEGKPSSQNNGIWAWPGCVMGVYFVFRGTSLANGRATVMFS